MATARSKMALPVGSTQWIQNERDQAQQFHELEVEEFGYAARNELDWLNEHMAEIFSRDQRNFADVFKTPGKLRGRTPMTARKRDAASVRAPLTDLFAPNAQPVLSPAANTAFYQKVSAQFAVAEDKEQSPPKGTSRRSPQRLGKGNTDSGYHGITEDEMDVDSRHPSATQSTFAGPSFVQPVAAEPALETLDENVQMDGRPTNDDDSFVSANEDAGNEKTNTQETDNATVADEDMEVEADFGDENENENEHENEGEDEDEDEDLDIQDAPSSPVQQSPAHEEHRESGNWQVEDDEDQEQLPATMDEDERLDVKSPSDASTPDKALVRKSSLTFAALPARETFKRSIGARASHVDAFGRNSVLGRQTHGKSLGASQQPADEGVARGTEDEEDVDEEVEDAEVAKVYDAAQMHNKTSTQRLHDRIAALGQSKEPRPSKSIPSMANSSGYPVLPKNDFAQTEEDDDDDWIAPIKTTSRSGSGADTNLALAQVQTEQTEDSRPSTAHTVESVPAPSPPKRMLGHQKSYSTITLTSPHKSAMLAQSLHKTTGSTSNPNLAHVMGVVQHTTPTSSPASKRFADAPLSASKAKLYSVLKSAKGIFASSASASAQAKLDGLASPSRTHLPTAQHDEPDMSKMPGGLYPDLSFAPLPAARPAEGRKTRSSTESDRRKDKDSVKQKDTIDALERARQQERQRAATQKEERVKTAQRPATARNDSQRSEEQSEADDMAPPPQPKSMLPPGKLRAPGRLVRPTRPATAPQQYKPAPVNIKIASQSQRLNTAQSDRSLDPTPPPTAGRTRAGSAQPTGPKAGAASTARVRALEAAARKKEQDEKAAQRKADQKKELERKRAAKAEEERRVEEERKAAEQKRIREERLAEQRRIQESRAAAQRQAEQRRQDEQRLQAAQEKARADQLAAAIEQEKQEKLRAQNYPRGDIQGTLRQLAQKEVTRPTVPAKSSKRAADAEDEPQQRPGVQRGPASYQQQDNKRRKTLEEDEGGAHERHSVMAPPKRPSNMRKNTQDTFSKFPNGYAHAPPPAAHHTQGMNMYKATVTTQHQIQHSKAPTHPNDMLKLSTARIPFAENANPSGPSYSQEPSSSKAPASAFKTPGRPASQMPKSTVKSSPMYANGENIALPEIATDSEDESDSDDEAPGPGGRAGGGFRAPSWVASPALRELLTQQQLVDPESVFGPIAPLQMDEVFKGSKTDRLKRFRERGSSARWIESGDAVTEEEKRRDVEMRGLLHKEGAWNIRQQMH